MARKIRIEYPGAIYHVMNRGDRREAIFKDDTDRRLFLETLGEACAKTGWVVHAYCLMGNHFHLVLETPLANLVAGMKWLLGTYTARFNRRHKLSGRLLSGRYKALVVDGSGTGYLRTVCDYVHLNPVRARLLTEDQGLEVYKKAGWAQEELARRAKGDSLKLRIAARLRRETTMTLKWISQRLAMGAWTHLNKRLYEQRRGKRRRGRRVAEPRN